MQVVWREPEAFDAGSMTGRLPTTFTGAFKVGINGKKKGH